jgi:hypothetical protein
VSGTWLKSEGRQESRRVGLQLKPARWRVPDDDIVEMGSKTGWQRKCAPENLLQEWIPAMIERIVGEEVPLRRE